MQIAIGQEAVLAVNAFIARVQKHVPQEGKQLIRAVAADDLRRIETVAAPDRLAQRRRRSVRIELKTVGEGANSFARLRRRTEGRFVG